MEEKTPIEIALRPWNIDDLPLLERTLGDPAMTVYLGGPESPEQLRARNEKYARIGETGTGQMFVILAGPERKAAGSVGFWETEEKGQTVWETGWSVVPEWQGHGIAARATIEAAKIARVEGKHRFFHAFPRTDNGPSNSVCRRVGFIFGGELDFEYPKGNPIRCNDWYLDLFADSPEITPA